MSGTGPPPGLLPVDKPSGPTSHDIVDRVRSTLRVKRVGHTGTLDPFASGLLLLLVGRATRLAEYMDLPRKSYRALVRLGRTTDTDDREGETLAEDPAERWRTLEVREVEEALARFRGSIQQRPPLYSAKKVGGETAYRKARRGEAVELPPVQVEVDELVLETLDPPRATLRVTCSTGTYLRSIARDLGEALGTGAYLEELRRTAVGDFRVEEALPPEWLDEPERVRAALLPPARALAHLATARLEGPEVRRFVNGGGVELASDGVSWDPEAMDAGDVGPVRVLNGEELLGVGEWRGDRLHPRKVVSGG